MRQQIAQNMSMTLNQTLWRDGYVTVEGIQLLELDFSSPFELSIENIQLQVQAVQINTNLQRVQQVLCIGVA